MQKLSTETETVIHFLWINTGCVFNILNFLYILYYILRICEIIYAFSFIHSALCG